MKIITCGHLLIASLVEKILEENGINFLDMTLLGQRPSPSQCKVRYYNSGPAKLLSLFLLTAILAEKCIRKAKTIQILML